MSNSGKNIIFILFLFFFVECFFAPKTIASGIQEGLIFESPVFFKKVEFVRQNTLEVRSYIGLSDIYTKGMWVSPHLFSFGISPTPQPTVAVSPFPTVIEVETTPIPSHEPVISAVTPTPLPPVIGGEDIWDSLASCESNNNWSIDTGNGYFGGLQFSQSAWESVGGVGNPAHASREEQIAKAKLLQERRGWGAWGACAKKLGLQ